MRPVQRDRAVALLPRLDRLRERAADDLVAVAVLAPGRRYRAELAEVGRRPRRCLDRFVLKPRGPAHLIYLADLVLAQNTTGGQKLLEHADQRLELGPFDKPLSVGEHVEVAGLAAVERFDVVGQIAFVERRALLRWVFRRPARVAPTP